MTYKLCHFLFGYDYIYWQNSVARGIARVYQFPDGGVYFWRYPTIKVLDIIHKPEQVQWLTCSSKKYFPTE